MRSAYRGCTDHEWPGPKAGALEDARQWGGIGGHHDPHPQAPGQRDPVVTEMKPARQIVSDMVEEAFAVFEEITGVEPGLDDD